jgi:maltose alpha-D-glucosyltransferase/alpha-amylase
MGNFKIIPMENPKVLAFIRECNGDKIMCVYNLSREATYFKIDLPDYVGKVLVEMVNYTRFPDIKAEHPSIYFTLTGHRFLWLKIVDPDHAPEKNY